MSDVIREPRFSFFGWRASLMVPPHGAGAGHSSGCVPLSLEKKPATKKKFDTSKCHLSILRYCMAIPRAVAFGVRLQCLPACIGSLFERSSLGRFRAPWEGSKTPFAPRYPLPSPRGDTFFCSHVTKGAKTHPLSLTLGIQRNRNPRKLIYDSARSSSDFCAPRFARESGLATSPLITGMRR